MSLFAYNKCGKENLAVMTENNSILIKGARVNNLKNIDVEIPRNRFVVITGFSEG